MTDQRKRADKLEKGILDAQKYFNAEREGGAIAFDIRTEQVPMQLAAMAAYQLKEAAELRAKLKATQAQMARLVMMVKATHQASAATVGTIDNPVAGSERAAMRPLLHSQCMTCRRLFAASERLGIVTGGAVCRPSCAEAKLRYDRPDVARIAFPEDAAKFADFALPTCAPVSLMERQRMGLTQCTYCAKRIEGGCEVLVSAAGAWCSPQCLRAHKGIDA